MKHPIADIVDRLRFWSETRNNQPTAWNLDCADAADEIERLRLLVGDAEFERDQARRLYCYLAARDYNGQKSVAEAREWDCFVDSKKEDK
jgi:hypothetical protein